MEKRFKITGMACNHCRAAVERALNSLDGVSAVVSLDPPAAAITFTGAELSVAELQAALSAAGDYTIE